MRQFVAIAVACWLSIASDQAADVRIAAAKPGMWVEGEGVLLVLAVSDGKRKYGVVAQRKDGTYSVFPAEMEMDVPEACLGLPACLMVMIADDTPNGRAPRRLVMRVQGVKPLTQKEE